MTRTVHVELAGPRACSELIEFLGTRGLAAEVVATNEHCELEIAYAVEPEARLSSEVGAALRSWLAEHESPLVLAEAGERSYVLRPAAE
jgi:hypothetical protein